MILLHSNLVCLSCIRCGKLRYLVFIVKGENTYVVYLAQKKCFNGHISSDFLDFSKSKFHLIEDSSCWSSANRCMTAIASGILISFKSELGREEASLSCRKRRDPSPWKMAFSMANLLRVLPQKNNSTSSAA
jgi:hypothetical protein